jgi:hypothetical protein
MAGTLVRRRGLLMLGESIVREIVIQLNKLIDDVEAVRAAASEFEGSATFNAASLADGAGETTTVTVTGAALGDFVTGVSLGVDLQGITVTAYVSAADTVSVRLQNESGGVLDLASTTLRVRVSSHSSAATAAALTAAKIGNDAGTAYSA